MTVTTLCHDIVHLILTLTTWLLKFLSPIFTKHIDDSCWIACHSFVQPVTASLPTNCTMGYWLNLFLKMATERFSETLEDPRSSKWPRPERQRHALPFRRQVPRTSVVLVLCVKLWPLRWRQRKRQEAGQNCLSSAEICILRRLIAVKNSNYIGWSICVALLRGWKMFTKSILWLDFGWQELLQWSGLRMIG